MGSYLDFIQRTVVFLLIVVGAVVYGAGNALIFLIVHNEPPFGWYILWIISQNLD